MADQTHVLFVEDDDVIREATQLALERDGFAVTAMPDGLSGLEAFRAHRPDIALLDVMVPGLDGVSLCRRIRDESTVPVIMLSARADSIDVVLGLEAGADDYVTKPFDGAVLVARIRAVLRRFGHAGGAAQTESPEPAVAGTLAFGELEIDTDGMEVRRSGQPVALTPTEMRLLLEFSAA
ncbi:response regulator, partial [Streptomyces sp. SID2955]|nr:response regulator [Streptomyces sp. SID2955]